MIISRTPFRISFFGGGTDYPAYFEQNKGAVFATTIDKYCYLNCRFLPPFFEHKSRIVWSLTELVNDIDKIKHPSVRECLKFMKIKKGMEIHHVADLPARTGIGSSSTFTVGLLKSLHALQGKMISKKQLAEDAIYVEQKMIKENVGNQDQTLASYGGFNLIEFFPGGESRVSPVTVDFERLRMLEEHLIFVFTGFTRTASKIAGELIKQTHKKKNELKTMYQFVYEAIKILNSNTDISEFGKLLHENWKLKRSLTGSVSTPAVDEIYSIARREGAVGGKLLGAGGGGFMLFFVKPELHPKIKRALKKFLYVPFKFENTGSQIILYQQETLY